jgi:hypothetical protein
VEIYNVGINPEAHALDFATQIDPSAKGPRLWLLVVRRVFGLGGLAVRSRRWDAVRMLASQRPRELGDYYRSWFRHALTMAARARHLHQQGPGQSAVSLISLARIDVERLGCLRDDGVLPDAEEVLNSLTQFDLLSILVTIADAGRVDTSDFYTSFAPYRDERTTPIVEALLANTEMRNEIFPADDQALAEALLAINEMASNEGMRYAGFGGFHRPALTECTREHRPPK